MSHKYLTNCLACDSAKLELYLDLKPQPPANSFNKGEKLESFPLQVMFCKDCSHSQLFLAVDPEVLFSHYIYVSGTTETLRSHFRESVNFLINHYYDSEKKPKIKVLEIGSNDGSFLEEFKKLGCEVQGVDPAKNLIKFSQKKEIPTLTDFWNSDTAFSLKGNFDIICALNCLPHNSNPYDFLKGCTRVLTSKGILVIDFVYIGSTLDLNDLGQLYHEHHSYFTVKSFLTLIERLNLYIIDEAFFPEIHGGTLRYILKRGLKPHCQKVRDSIVEEKKEGFHNIEKYLEFTSTIKDEVLELEKTLEALFESYKIVCYSASAKSSTLFNSFPNLVKYISYIVDDNPLKQGLRSPGNSLEIKSPEILKKEKDLIILITAHNFKSEIKKKLKKMGIKGKILNYVPDISLEEI